MSSRCPVCDHRVPVDRDGEPCSTHCLVVRLTEDDPSDMVELTDKLVGLLREARQHWPDGYGEAYLKRVDAAVKDLP